MTHKITELKGKDMLRKLLRFRLATITVTAVIILFISDVLYFTPPWKITDPTDPNFEISEKIHNIM